MMTRVGYLELVALMFASGAVGCTAETLDLVSTVVIPEMLDLGDCGVGLECEGMFEVLNNSDAPISISAVELDENSERLEYQFRVSEQPSQVDARSRAPLRVVFLALEAMSASVTTRMRVVGSAGAVSVTVHARGVPAIAIEPQVLDFGTVERGASDDRTLRIRNLVDAPITMRRLSAPASSGGGRFDQLSMFTAPIQPNATLQVPVRYTPSEDDGPPDDDRTEWTFTYCDHTVCERKVELRGTRTQIDPMPACLEVVPARIDFGAVLLGESRIEEATVFNRCTTPATIRSIEADTARTGAFSVNVAPAVIEANGALTLSVSFQPTTIGTVESEMVMNTDDPVNAVLRVALLGGGESSFAPCDLWIQNLETFGDTEVRRTRTGIAGLYNVGVDPCPLRAPTLIGNDPGNFAILSSPSIVAPGEVGIFEFSYTPNDPGSDDAVLYVESDETLFTRYFIGLEGSGSVDTPVIYPDKLDFGAVTAGCASTTRTARIFNHRDVPLVINELIIGGSSDFALNAPALPLSIPPHESYALEVAYAPTFSAIALGHIRMIEAGSFVPWIVWLWGRAGELTEERFAQPVQSAVDVVFVIEPSIMLPYEDFTAFANASGADYHIATATVTIGHFHDAQQSLRVPLLYGPTADYFRRDARLEMVFVANTDDTSALPVELYADEFLGIHGSRNKNWLRFHTVTGGPTGCVGPGGPADPAPRFMDLASIAPGVNASICADSSTMFGSLANAIFGTRNDFLLENAPAQGTLDVAVNGVSVPQIDANGMRIWSTVSGSKLVSFTSFGTPVTGSEIVISYVRACL